jgi:hypothetical protein
MQITNNRCFERLVVPGDFRVEEVHRISVPSRFELHDKL